MIGPLNALGRLAAAAIIAASLTEAPAAQGVTANRAAIDYLQSLPADTKIYVWPTKVRTFEILGFGDLSHASAAVGEYGQTHPYTVLLSVPFGPPAFISIFVYKGPDDPWSEFESASRLPASFKLAVGNMILNADACFFTGLIARDTWTSGGVVFLDSTRLDEEHEQRECVELGLDYINGFPAARRFDYEDLPDREVRLPILAAINACSMEGEGATERTKDGLTPLPTIACVVDKLAR